MKTTHQFYFKNSKDMSEVSSKSVDLVVTSPPYPMIEMWDEVFSLQDKTIGKALNANDGPAAFELMHRQLDSVWAEVDRVLKPSSIVCVNIGDATRTIRDNFALYSNHSRIISFFLKQGFTVMPVILWRKQTNAPNKFMGSGMYPPGAYVTLEHEYILIFRKGGKREFKASEKPNRRESAYFWEERNNWFSDVWMDLKGATQKLFDKNTRNRSGAFPFILPFRLIHMFSVRGDTVLDPFAGLGTTTFAAMSAQRNSIGYEIDENLRESIQSKVDTIVDFSNEHIRARLERHREFVEERIAAEKPLKHTNLHYGFPVITKQEKDLVFHPLLSAEQVRDDTFEVRYGAEEQRTETDTPEPATKKPAGKKKKPSPPKPDSEKGHKQMTLLD